MAPRVNQITFETMDMLVLGDLRTFLENVAKMPNDAQIQFIPESLNDGERIGGGVRAIWQTRNPL